MPTTEKIKKDKRKSYQFEIGGWVVILRYDNNATNNIKRKHINWKFTCSDIDWGASFYLKKSWKPLSFRALSNVLPTHIHICLEKSQWNLFMLSFTKVKHWELQHDNNLMYCTLRIVSQSNHFDGVWKFSW